MGAFKQRLLVFQYNILNSIAILWISTAELNLLLLLIIIVLSSVATYACISPVTPRNLEASYKGNLVNWRTQLCLKKIINIHPRIRGEFQYAFSLITQGITFLICIYSYAPPKKEVIDSLVSFWFENWQVDYYFCAI